MSLKIKSEGRQVSDFAYAPFTYEDLNSTDFIPVVELPADAVLIGVSLAIITAFDAVATIAVGTSAAPTGFLGATAADALAITRAADSTLGNHDVQGVVDDIGLTSSAVMTEGKGVLLVEYIRAFRVGHSQG
jgi:hypothetical protein